MPSPGSLELSLPAGWQPLSPGELNLDVAFLALKLDTHGSGFTATVVVECLVVRPGTALAELADNAAAAQPAAVVTDRRGWQGPRGPRLRQVLRLSGATAQESQRLVRAEEYVALVESASPTGTPVLRATSTATLDQADEIAADFAQMLSALDSDRAVRRKPLESREGRDSDGRADDRRRHAEGGIREAAR
ncbi:hypothetical protein [Prauserella muralis]|uniref:Uncharacterized protein n=1 Tax=Prauserella muralis TaxID=588067 RepID=A0A2V4AS39_9PSEU|nr:hypothetical protein [Prauserella muralis]PXY22834.1 hypothetical protein BAY60_23930 [Prauserella muralis]TWE28586.1 hypothetical protein FHX69_1243 [Prauserella muralis]